MTSKYKSLIRKVSSLIFLLIAWELCVVAHVPYLSNIPSPIAVLQEGIHYIPGAKYITNILFSMARIFVGFTLAAIVGIPLGLAMGWNRKFRWLTFPLFEVLRPIPVIAWIPIAVIMFKSTEFSIWWLIFLGAFFPIGLNTLHGTSSVPIEQVRAAQSLGASRKDLLLKVILPSAAPAIYTGMTISMGLTWVILVAAEMVAGGFGVGYMTWEAYVLVTYPRIILGMLTIGACGWMFSAAIRKIADISMPWAKIF